MKKLTSLILLFAGIVLVSCEKDYYKPAPVIDLATPISFKNDIMPIFEANCYGSGCHDKGIAPKLTAADAYDELIMNAYVDTLDAENCKLYIRMVSTKNPMPPKGLLSAEKTNKILAWIKQGALNN